MPIVDYKKVAEVSEKKLFSREDITDTNKEYLRKFLNSYDVSHARVSLFCKHIYFFVKETDDVKKILYDRDKVNQIFKKIRESVKQGYYETIKQVSIRFVKWLNDEDEKPKGFKDIKNSKKGQKRKLRPSDMLTWEEGLIMARKTNSIQLKALILTQLEGGFRPSEFVDINIGDIKKEGRFLEVFVHASKTGDERNVTLFKSVPYLNAWLENHPLKRKDSPLWIIEKKGKSHYKKKKKVEIRYRYQAMVKRVRTIAKECKIKKPMDFYSLRHSACTLAKKDNMPTDLAAKKFGHSEKYYVNTYGRLTEDENRNRLKKHYGLKKDIKKEKSETIECSFCNTINIPNSEYCSKCRNPLSMKQAVDDLHDVKKLKKEIQFLRKQWKAATKMHNREEIWADMLRELIDFTPDKELKKSPKLYAFKHRKRISKPIDLNKPLKKYPLYEEDYDINEEYED